MKIDATLVFTADYALTKNQLIQVVLQKLGGWPMDGVALHRFLTKEKETVYRFSNERGNTIGDTQRLKDTEFWDEAVTRDEFIFKFLSREAIAKFKLEAKQELMQRMMGAIR